MPRFVSTAHVEPVVRTLLGAIDTGDGGTAEQRAVLHALVAGYWDRPDLRLDAITPFDPEDAAAAITEPVVRRETRELMVLLESCRHPLSEAQVERVDAYGATLHQDGRGDDEQGMALLRDFVRGGATAAMADYQRYIDERRRELSETSLVAEHVGMGDAPEPELADRLRALHNLPAGTLGYEYVEFYRRNGLTLPGDDPSMPAVFVSHDMCHVIAGYEPTGPEEIALGAMQLCVADNENHWVQFLGNLAVHEAGFFSNESVTGKTATLARAGSAELIAEAMRRGSECIGDFTAADHLALADVPLAEVRARFGVPARSA
jgi:hypothetical protein